ncbi:hydrogenase 4 subunit F [Roseomonas alkaliterrae]|uniref:Hydrogenase-4 component F n=1 Tax=Neoroseomonas alkaliterrae TaxID=1452450 RepID=A0A840YC30_9PROT|nr:hydrogenase 4 subunit F [Neoroseomonas alkaliterrae]MBB5691513.1 hydrogenase-4 component F [Neoroseomonas alkaliterrae]MBR0677872.1 hydrogenase 4 subunit F [Neoroseomonas alkaliterrae]
MSLQWAIVFLPWLGAAALAAVPRLRPATAGNVALSGLTFAMALALAAQPFGQEGWTRVDALNLPFLVLSAFVGLTTAVFSAATLDQEGFDHWRIRAYHAAYQVFMGAQFLALLADNLGVMWVAIEIATLATVSMVAVHRTPAAFEAAWKFFILCGVGIALALFGTIVLYLAAQPLLHEENGLSWAALMQVAPDCAPGTLNLAFAFLLLGYGTKAGLVPLHSWLPDAHAEGPVPISAVLSGLLLNAAMLAVLRAKSIVGANPEAIAPGPFLLGLGLATVTLAAIALWRRRDARRFFGWSSIEHMGIAAFAFGLGGAAANLAGLLHLLGHSLVKSAVFFGVGRAAQAKGSQKIADIQGLVTTHPALGWGLAIAIAGIAGLPPMLLFASEFRLLSAAAAQMPWLALALALAMVVALAALVTVLQAMCFGPPTPDAAGALDGWREAAAAAPLWLHLAVATALALAMPAGLAAMLAEAARVIG